jgi:hypothetical protein
VGKLTALLDRTVVDRAHTEQVPHPPPPVPLPPSAILCYCAYPQPHL